MPSPFPGMDPYLEQSGAWGDFHSTFINYLRNAINDRLPGSYDARIQERITLIESFDNPRQSFEPDVIVGRERAAGSGAGREGAGPALLEPVTVPLIIPEKTRESYIEIYDYSDQALITVIEVLSPTNKLSKGRDEYLFKRDAILTQEVHLVELDFLAGGQRLPTAEPLPQDDYYAFVARHERRPLCEVYHWSVRQPLPAIPIPLKSPDPDVIVELQPVFAETFARGRYERRLNYAAPPRARLSWSDRQWAAQLAAAYRQQQ
ncbi:MAG: DUF4058 family protein [Pirellulales bacterium]